MNVRADDPEDFRPRRSGPPTWAWSIPLILTVVGWIYTSGALTQKVNAQEPINKVLFEKVNKTGDMVIAHSTAIPQIEKRLDKMDEKLDRILMEVKK